MAGDVVLGLDLSLTGLGMCAAPADWDLDWRRVRSLTLGVELERTATERAHTHRLVALALDVRTWAIRVGATRVFVEDLPRRGFNLVRLAELRGVVRRELLLECGLDIEFIQARKARELLYGRNPPKGLSDRARKAWLVEPVKLAGGRFRDHDQVDAFAVLNAGMERSGGPFHRWLLGPPEPKTVRKRRPRVRKARRRQSARKAAA